MKFYTIIILSALLLTSSKGYSNGVSGGGGGGGKGGGQQFSHFHSAWWGYKKTDEEPTITYCYELSSQFEVQERKRIEKAIDDAFEKFKKLYEKTHNPKYKYSLAFKRELLPTCSGDEVLKIKLGREKGEEIPYLWKSDCGWVSPNEAAENTVFTKGSIFIAHHDLENEKWRTFTLPDWRIEGNLEAIILHEIGHIYGFPHRKHTIMRDDLCLALELKRIHQRDKTRINHQNAYFYDEIIKGASIVKHNKDAKAWDIGVENGSKLQFEYEIESKTHSVNNIRGDTFFRFIRKWDGKTRKQFRHVPTGTYYGHIDGKSAVLDINSQEAPVILRSSQGGSWETKLAIPRF